MNIQKNKLLSLFLFSFFSLSFSPPGYTDTTPIPVPVTTYEHQVGQGLVGTKIADLPAGSTLQGIASWPLIKEHGIVTGNKCSEIAAMNSGKATTILPGSLRAYLNQYKSKMLCFVLTEEEAEWVSNEFSKYVSVSSTAAANDPENTEIREAFRKVYAAIPEILAAEEYLFAAHANP